MSSMSSRVHWSKTPVTTTFMPVNARPEKGWVGGGGGEKGNGGEEWGGRGGAGGVKLRGAREEGIERHDGG